MTTTPESRLTRRAFVEFAGALAMVTLLSPPLVAAADNQPLQIWFIRHGESEINVGGGPRVHDSGVTYPLTRTGVEQARALAAAISDVPITKIYSSTRLRAIQTADAVAFAHTLTLSLAPEAVEIDFGLTADANQDGRAIYTGLARKWLVDRDLEARHGSGESYADVQRRFLPFVREVMNRHAQDAGVVVIVAHSATIGFMMPMLAGNVPADFALRHSLPNTGIVKTELRDGRLFCTDWAGIASSQFDE